MPNDITLFKKYIDLLDEVYMECALTDDRYTSAVINKIVASPYNLT